MSSRRHPPAQVAAIVLLLVLTYLQFSTLAVTSPTLDEPNHLVSGYAYLTRGDTRIKLNGPILPNALGALPLLLQPGLALSSPDDPGWDTNQYNDIADRFLWSNTASPFHIIYLARFPFMAAGWLLGALIFRWARERNGARAGLFALGFYVFCPNLLAHSRFVMTDFVPAALTCLTLYTFDRSMHSDRPAWTVAAGMALGLALASKFSLVMLTPSIAILLFMHNGWRSTRRSLGQLALTVLVAAVAVWGVYSFQVAPVSAGGLPLPAPGFWGEVESARYVLGQPWPNYLFGQISDSGWWYYFPIAFLVKTPLPVLILLAVALARTIHTRSWRREAILLLPSFLLAFGLLFSTNNLGYRYLLPLLPLIFVYVSDLVPKSSFALSPRHLVTLSLLVWHIIGALRIYPFYLTFFNEIAGGPDRGRYVLSDSNLDWGQDMAGLKQYVEENGIDRIKLSYFGIAHPTAYGLKTEPLLPIRSAMHDQGAWWLHTYYPHDPPPGVYAISVANLMGGIWIDRETYTYFRDRKPDTTIGNSIYIFTISPRGEPVGLSLAGLQIDQIDPDTYTRFGANDVRPRWFDATISLIAAPGESWVAISDLQSLPPEFAVLFDDVQPIARPRTVNDGQPYRLYRLDLAGRMRGAAAQAEQVVQAGALPATFGHTAELIGYRLAKDSERPQGVTLVTTWRAGDDVVTPLQLFVHAVDASDQIVAQADRLDASAYGWREGDTIAQVSRLALPAASDPISIRVGLYNVDTGVRLPVTIDGRAVGDYVLLKQVALNPGYSVLY
ncbi:MAG TPA: glycosyltransferase family 39 protein [Anaerolineae bacterium]|nr:glycosyltransferase family 39 protein [Anaerolineae bacterium]